MSALLILRPEPGASESAAKARGMGLAPVVAPLFTVTALSWEPPDPRRFDALLLTSANAARHGGSGLDAYRGLTCFAVGDATAAAARRAGFTDIRVGAGDGLDALALARESGARRILHLCGRDHRPIEAPGLSVARQVVYASDPVASLPAAAREALAEGALALLHSPRAAIQLARLVEAAGLDRTRIELAAISPAAALAAGRGWRAEHVASAPRDEALLELAAKLCQTKIRTLGS